MNCCLDSNTSNVNLNQEVFLCMAKRSKDSNTSNVNLNPLFPSTLMRYYLDSNTSNVNLNPLTGAINPVMVMKFKYIEC